MKALSKSDRTRELILRAARHLFGQRGYESTTVRDVAERARIDPALIIRYFGSKDGLFVEAASVELQLPTLADIAPADLGRAMVEHFLDLWEGTGTKQGLAVLLRSAASNDYAATKMREAFLAQVMPFVTTLGDPTTAPRRAGLISSQLLGLAMCRYVLKLPPVVALTRAEIVASLGPTLQSHISDG